MSKIIFNDNETKKYYRDLLRFHPGLAGIMLKLSRDKKVIIKSIIRDSYNVTIKTMVNEENIDIYVDFINNRICLINPSKQYKEIYANYYQDKPRPVGYEYENNTRKIIKKDILRYSDEPKNIYYYDIFDNGHSYNVLIKEDSGLFTNDDFINRILYATNKYNSIRDLFITLTNSFNISKLDIKITDSKGSIIVIESGSIKDFTEYRENDNEYQKIYLENDEFYCEKKVKEVYQDNLTSYIKKIGENNGKEKR